MARQAENLDKQYHDPIDQLRWLAKVGRLHAPELLENLQEVGCDLTTDHSVREWFRNVGINPKTLTDATRKKNGEEEPIPPEERSGPPTKHHEPIRRVYERFRRLKTGRKSPAEEMRDQLIGGIHQLTENQLYELERLGVIGEVEVMAAETQAARAAQRPRMNKRQPATPPPAIAGTGESDAG